MESSEDWRQNQGGRIEVKRPFDTATSYAGIRFDREIAGHIKGNVGIIENRQVAQDICVVVDSSGWHFGLAGSPGCSADKAGRVSPLVPRCSLSLNAGLIAGETYAILVHYAVPYPSWSEQFEHYPTGAFFSSEMPVGPDEAILFAYADVSDYADGDAHGMRMYSDGINKQGHVITPLFDGQRLVFCQRGTGVYVIDDIRVWRLK
jgi:hypothetical protein